MNSRRSMAILSTVAVLSFVGTASTTVHAETQDERTIALGLFEQGRKLRTEGQFAEATNKFEGAAKLMRTYGILLNLAECYEKLGRVASAWSTWREAEFVARNQQHADDEQRARERVRALEPELSYLTILVPEAHRVAGLTVLRNGISVPSAAWATPLPIDPGAQRIVARAPGYREWTSEVVLRAQVDKPVVEVPLLEAEGPTQPQSAPQPNASQSQQPMAAPATGANAAHREIPRWLGPVVGGAGFVTMVVGAVIWKTGQGRLDDARSEANRAIAENNRALYDQAGADHSSAKNLRTAGIVTTCAGAALGLGGLAWTLLQPKPAPASGAGAVRANAWFDGKNGTIGLMGAF